MNSKLLDNKSATKSVSSAREKNKVVSDSLKTSGIKKINFTSITPPSIKKETVPFKTVVTVIKGSEKAQNGISMRQGL